MTLAVLLLTATGMLAASSQAATPQTVRVTVSTAGVAENRDPGAFDISGDGNLVVFSSQASNLIPHDTNGKSDVFLRNLAAGTTNRVSISSSGRQSVGPCYDPSISADGRYIAFEAAAPNLVAGDTNGAYDIYVRDTAAHTLTRVSTSSTGAQADGASLSPQISKDGRFVVFYSFATNLIANDHNGLADVFRKNLQTGAIQRVSVSSTGVAGNGESAWPRISQDGRYVAFESEANNLIPTDLGTAYHQVFVRDMQLGTTSLVSQNTAGDHADDFSYIVGISNVFSSDGRYILFDSKGANLAPTDFTDNQDAFVRDTKLGTTRQVDLGTTNTEPVFGADANAISADGRYVLFSSTDANLIPHDANGRFDDVFMRDLVSSTTALVSRSSAGTQGNSDSFGGPFSADGRFFAFISAATNLVAADSNGHQDIFRRGPLN